MKLISWNVNGIRAVLGKGFLDYVNREDPDVLCLQETRAHPDQVDLALEQFPHHYWNSADKKGYSGTAVFSKKEPLALTREIGIEEHAGEGRVLALEFSDFFLVNVYTPNAQNELTRLDYRMEWDRDFLKYLKKLETKKPVVFCGDLNVAHKEIDLKNPQANRGNAGFTDEEREGFSNYIKAGFLDAFREFHEGPGHYTWWSYRFNARARNIGWRIDYFCLSASLRPRLKDAFIRSEVTGSDHCPVGIILE
ncbi:MAG: exodeoxyribonuclease III [Nitrospinae bacterium]|nr:exodeoxyribonuclease III [Nitrospinota bacterium]